MFSVVMARPAEARDRRDLYASADEAGGRSGPECGYPFPDEARPLRSKKGENSVHVAHTDAYWESMWIADIVRSAKVIRSSSLLEELASLCSVPRMPRCRNNHARHSRGSSDGYERTGRIAEPGDYHMTAGHREQGEMEVLKGTEISLNEVRIL
jgi:hypothetical protein